MLNWDAIGAIAELLGSVAVLVTLLYIAIQVRDAKRMNEISISANRTTNIAARIVDNPHLAEILAKIRVKTGQISAIEMAKHEWELSDAEAETWFRYMGTIYRGVEAQYLATGEVSKSMILMVRSDPQAVLYFKYAKNLYQPSFVEAISSVTPQ